MLKLKSKNKLNILNIPTNINEIDKEFISTRVKDLNLADNYCAIAVIYKVNLFEFVNMINDNKNRESKTLNIIVKSNSSKDYIKIYNKAIINPIEIERAINFNPKNNTLNPTFIAEWIKKEKETMLNIMKGKDLNIDNEKDVDTSTLNIYLVEFKIIPINSIVATMNYEI